MREPIAVPALESNYIWLLPTGDNPGCDPRGIYLIDPGDADPALRALTDHRLALQAVLITHHHWDHTDGLRALLEQYPVPVYGPESVSSVDHPVRDGDTLNLPGLELEVMAVPGHTLDHLAYFQPKERRLFCGDALFAGGCGRLLGGTPEQALTSLDRLARLPDDTRLYCAHEYTRTNLRFAASVEPDNSAVTQRLAAVTDDRAHNRPTLPSELGLERLTNPFLRTDDARIRASLGFDTSAGRVAVFTELRRLKDRFR